MKGHIMEPKDVYSNSFKSKEEKEPKTKQVKKVIQGKAKIKNPGFFQNMVKTFIGGDIQDIKHDIMFDVVIPSLKKMISEAIDTLFHTDSSRNRTPSSKTSYSRYYDEPSSRVVSSSRTSESYNSVYDYEKLEYESRRDAETVIDAINDMLQQYPNAPVSVLDLYDYSQISCDNPQASRYGWKSIEGAKIVRDMNGWYRIRLPKAKPIN